MRQCDGCEGSFSSFSLSLRMFIHVCVIWTEARHTPDQRVYTRAEFPWAERYSHAVVGTRFQKDLVRDLWA